MRSKNVLELCLRKAYTYGTHMQNFADIFQAIADFLPSKDWSQDLIFLRLLIAVALALGVAYLIIRYANRYLPKLAEKVTDQAAARTHGDKLLRVRRTETMLSIAAAIGRTLIIGLCLYIAWRIANPGSAPLAIIGASTFFFIIGVATVSPLLRDLTSGILMISERWYEVGDHVVVDPFWEMSGVVEQINLRSTKLRSISGEVVWIHNQHIQGVRVTPRGLRTISVDTFVNDLERGRALIEQVIATLSTGPTMVATPLAIKDEEKVGTNVWRITAVGQTAPGREWLIREFAREALMKSSSENEDGPILVYDPIVRYTDPAAEHRFWRSILGNQAFAAKRS